MSGEKKLLASFSKDVEDKSKVAQSCPTLYDPVDCSLPSPSVHGIPQARILEWVAISFSRGSSRPRDWTWVSHIAGRRFTLWTTREAKKKTKRKKPIMGNKWFSSVQSLSRVRLFATPWITANQASLSITNSQGVHSNSHPPSQWCHPAISSSVIPFSSCPQSLSASESFPMSQLFSWGGQSTGSSAVASFLPKNTQGWSPLEWTGWIFLQWLGSHKSTRKCVLMASYCKAKRNPLCYLCMIILWSP